MIEFVELQANEDCAGVLAAFHHMKGYLADKDFRTQYESAKAWHKKRLLELGWEVTLDAWSDTDKQINV